VVKTLRNNLIAILIHLITNTIVFFAYGTPNSFPKYGFLGETLIFLIVLLLYFTFGYLLTGNALRYQNTKTKNITSVSSIFILGLLAWAYKFIADARWLFGFFIYNYYAIPLYPIFVHFHYENPLSLVDLEILFSLLPALLIWVGMELKYSKKNRQNKAKNNLEIQS
jgi:hypothetical protein